MNFGKLLLVATALGSTLVSSQATLLNFDDHALGGTTASWDIFYGGNYLPSFSYQTGTTGNPILDSPSNLTLNMQVVGFKPSFPSPNYATGPLDSDGGTVPGNHEEFYTFFSSNGAWSINMTTLGEVDHIVFQIQEIDVDASALSAVFLNGIAGSMTFDTSTDVSTWEWTGLNLDAGSNVSLTWTTGQHASFDAFQLQVDAQAVPEPTVAALMVCSAAALVLRRRVRNRK